MVSLTEILAVVRADIAERVRGSDQFGGLAPIAAPLPCIFRDLLVVGIVAFALPARTTLFFWGCYAGRAMSLAPD